MSLETSRFRHTDPMKIQLTYVEDLLQATYCILVLSSVCIFLTIIWGNLLWKKKRKLSECPQTHIARMGWRGAFKFRVPSNILPCFCFHFTRGFLSLSLLFCFLLSLCPLPRRRPSPGPVGSTFNFMDHPERSLPLSPRFLIDMPSLMQFDDKGQTNRSRT